jgi:ectoine hydroxylase-related dioxygenase (phytanoyl-CoA dioxygenase family)
MTPEQILALKPKVLTQKQREDYFNDGFICVQKAIGDEWIAKLRAATDEMVARSRKVAKSDKVFDLEPRHTPDAPRLRRVSNPNEQHPAYWDYCLKSPMADIVSDLVGPDVKFHHSKLNFKWANGGEEVKWHYDISFYPHTNYSPLTVGTYLYDCGMEQGPLACLPGSHRIDPMPTQYNAEGHWTGCRRQEARRHVQGQVPAGTGGLDHHPQLPHAALLGAERFRHRPPAAAERDELGRRFPLYREPDPAGARRLHPARAARARGAPRPAPLPDAAGLVQGLYLDLHAAAGRREGTDRPLRRNLRRGRTPAGARPAARAVPPG